MRKLFWALFLRIHSGTKIEGHYYLCNRGIGDTVIFFSKLKYMGNDLPKKKIKVIIQENQKGIVGAYSQYIEECIVLNRKAMKFCIELANKRLIPHNITFIIPKGSNAFLGYQGLSISDLMNITLGIPAEIIEYEKPKFTWREGRQQAVIADHGLGNHPFVILGIDAVSVAGIDSHIWEDIAGCLGQKGYKVVSNLGSPGQAPIKGTIGLCIPLDEMYLLAEYGGWFIGLRSGLCDLLAFSDCKMTVIYPSQEARYKYTFANMHFKKGIEEIMVDEVETWMEKF